VQHTVFVDAESIGGMMSDVMTHGESRTSGCKRELMQSGFVFNNVSVKKKGRSFSNSTSHEIAASAI
ncbi:MAG: hypothetical protein ACREQW_01315, partial [Candidatus Binatia bacterium]